jgi:hypothetical protein
VNDDRSSAETRIERVESLRHLALQRRFHSREMFDRGAFETKKFQSLRDIRARARGGVFSVAQGRRSYKFAGALAPT